MRGKEFPQKKVLSLVLCVAVMLSVMVTGAGAAFSDQDKIENTEAVNMCTALNIIGGYPDGSLSLIHILPVEHTALYPAEEKFSLIQRQ